MQTGERKDNYGHRNQFSISQSQSVKGNSCETFGNDRNKRGRTLIVQAGMIAEALWKLAFLFPLGAKLVPFQFHNSIVKGSPTEGDVVEVKY